MIRPFASFRHLLTYLFLEPILVHEVDEKADLEDCEQASELGKSLQQTRWIILIILHILQNLKIEINSISIITIYFCVLRDELKSFDCVIRFTDVLVYKLRITFEFNKREFLICLGLIWNTLSVNIHKGQSAS